MSPFTFFDVLQERGVVVTFDFRKELIGPGVALFSATACDIGKTASLETSRLVEAWRWLERELESGRLARAPVAEDA